MNYINNLFTHAHLSSTGFLKFLTAVRLFFTNRKNYNLERKLVSENLASVQVCKEFARLCLDLKRTLFKMYGSQCLSFRRFSQGPVQVVRPRVVQSDTGMRSWQCLSNEEKGSDLARSC